MNTLSQTKFKVDRIKLIEILEKVLVQGEKDYQKRVSVHEAAKVKAAHEIQEKIKSLVVDPNSEQFDIGYDRIVNISVSSKTKVPAKPRDNACDLRNTIAVLKISPEATVPLSAEQYQRYFPCNVD